MGIFDSFKKTKNENREVLWKKTFLIVGEGHECLKDETKKRADIMKKTKLKTPVHIEQFDQGKEPGYMIVNTRKDLDIGVLSRGSASSLAEVFDKGIVEATLVEEVKNSFRVKVVVYKETE